MDPHPSKHPDDALARAALDHWDLPAGAAARLINLSENATYLVEADGGFKSVLRVHRDGYQTRAAIASELNWMAALQHEGGVETPDVLPTRDGDQMLELRAGSPATQRFAVMFAFIEGAAPDESQDLVPGFFELGQIAARCHAHVLDWQRPQGFQRRSWDLEAVFGARPVWGNWRAAPGVTADVAGVLERVEARVCDRLTRFGRAPERFNLIHADMRLANLIKAPQGTRLIDFDDCGFGWFLYDFAAAISFMEDDPRVPALKAAWLKGYRSRRNLGAEDEAEIDSFVMLRRMALLAWIGSHLEAPEPQVLAPGFAEGTARLGAAYLRDASA